MHERVADADQTTEHDEVRLDIIEVGSIDAVQHYANYGLGIVFPLERPVLDYVRYGLGYCCSSSINISTLRVMDDSDDDAALPHLSP